VHLADHIDDEGGLYDVGWYLRFTPGRSDATLDGQFTADDLEAIAVYMRAHAPLHPNDKGET
jgi:hypothetical protein